MIRTLVSVLAVVLCVAAVAVPAAASQEGKAPAKPSRAAASSQIVNVNTASAADFEALPGIGPKLAARIIDYRQKNGPFKKLEDLMNVQGLGEKNFLKLKPQLTLATKTAAQPER